MGGAFASLPRRKRLLSRSGVAEFARLLLAADGGSGGGGLAGKFGVFGSGGAELGLPRRDFSSFLDPHPPRPHAEENPRRDPEQGGGKEEKARTEHDGLRKEYPFLDNTRTVDEPLILASASPRRRELLEQLGIPFEVRIAEVNEDALRREGDPPDVVAQALAHAKAEAVYRQYEGRRVLGADTVVAQPVGERWRFFGKPSGTEEATEMLQALRSTDHWVSTGVALLSQEFGMSGHSMARVRLRDLTDTEIAHYIATGDPFDKAGGYSIQHRMKLVKEFDGEYEGIVGLPLSVVRKIFGIQLTEEDLVLFANSSSHCTPAIAFTNVWATNG